MFEVANLCWKIINCSYHQHIISTSSADTSWILLLGVYLNRSRMQDALMTISIPWHWSCSNLKTQVYKQKHDSINQWDTLWHFSFVFADAQTALPNYTLISQHIQLKYQINKNTDQVLIRRKQFQPPKKTKARSGGLGRSDYATK